MGTKKKKTEAQELNYTAKFVEPYSPLLDILDASDESGKKTTVKITRVNGAILAEIGGPEFKPTPEDLENWRNLLDRVVNDKDFKIITDSEIEINPEIKSATAVFHSNPTWFESWGKDEEQLENVLFEKYKAFIIAQRNLRIAEKEFDDAVEAHEIFIDDAKNI